MIPDNGINPEPGPWRNDRTPYLPGMLDAVAEDGVQEIVVLKPTQVGFTEAGQIWIGWFIDVDPGASMIVMPDELSAKEVIDERYLPTIEATPALKRHLTGRPWDSSKFKIKLDTMPVFVGWAGSPMRMASRAIRRLFLDEVDKYPPFSGKEADPISLAIKRVSNWGHRSCVIIGSTPTTRDGNVWRRWEMCADKRRFYVPCQKCGHMQILSFEQLKWPRLNGEKMQKAEKMRTDRTARYECESCGFQHEDGHHKAHMLKNGRWVSDGQSPQADGSVIGQPVKSKRVGFHINSLYSPWIDWSDMAAEFIEADGDRTLMMDFRNSRLALPFEDQIASPKLNVFEKKLDQARSAGWEALAVPSWAGIITSAVDTQKDYFLITVRAWGHAYKSRLIHYCRAETFEDVRRIALDTPFKVDGGGWMKPRLMVIDSGGTKSEGEDLSRTQQVYQFALTDPARIYPIKGNSQPQAQPIRHTKVSCTAPDAGEDRRLALRLIDPNYFKDVLASRISIVEGGEGEWQLSKAAADDEYLRGMPVEHKIYDRKRSRYVWAPVSGGAAKRNHPWDMESYQCAAADMAAVALIPPEEELERSRSETQEQEMKGRRVAGSREEDSKRGRKSWLKSHEGRY